MKGFVSYKDWLIEADVTPSVNKHMTHAEDLVLSGKEGIDWVVNMFKELYEKLKSDTEQDKVRLSIKFDGAPSVFVWSKFPGLEKAGLAIKGLFAKDRKIMYNDKQIDHFYSEQPDLAKKLKLMLHYIPTIGIPENEIWQGDFLYDKDTLGKDNSYYSFHPNTIVYKVPVDSDLGKKIANTDIGVVWHTRYKGNSLDDISAQYNTKTSELKENPKVFMTDPYIASLAGYVTLTEEEKREFEDEIYSIESVAKNLSKSKEYNQILSNKDLIDLFNIYQNSLIRANVKMKNAEGQVGEFYEFLQNRGSAEREKKKTEKAKEQIDQKYEKLQNDLNKNKDTWQLLISLMIGIAKLKNMFIRKLNNIGKFETYLETNSGRFLSTGQEGFAVSDIHGNVVKLVDRYEFSFANFSPRIVKGWTKK